METKLNQQLSLPQLSVMVTCTDKERVNDISCYYRDMIRLLKLSNRLTEEEKLGQQDFLIQEWELETLPFLKLWRVQLYE